MRVYPPIPLHIGRWASRETTICGKTIPQVMIMIMTMMIMTIMMMMIRAPEFWLPCGVYTMIQHFGTILGGRYFFSFVFPPIFFTLGSGNIGGDNHDNDNLCRWLYHGYFASSHHPLDLPIADLTPKDLPRPIETRSSRWPTCRLETGQEIALGGDHPHCHHDDHMCVEFIFKQTLKQPSW